MSGRFIRRQRGDVRGSVRVARASEGRRVGDSGLKIRSAMGQGGTGLAIDEVEPVGRSERQADSKRISQARRAT